MQPSFDASALTASPRCLPLGSSSGERGAPKASQGFNLRLFRVRVNHVGQRGQRAPERCRLICRGVPAPSASRGADEPARSLDSLSPAKRKLPREAHPRREVKASAGVTSPGLTSSAGSWRYRACPARGSPPPRSDRPVQGVGSRRWPRSRPGCGGSRPPRPPPLAGIDLILGGIMK